MNKDEILAKSRKENKDERDLFIGKTANENAYVAVTLVFSLLSIVLFLQKLIFDTAFADYRVFVLALLIGSSGQSVTTYYYDRQRKSILIAAFLEIIGAIACLISIIASGMGWI
ncbi:DUF6442 family protein [Anaerotignum propionicum]|uniref:Uncharacterized protein n=1 Tax=Anaerotignum propionicum DSM 1682 TaxID=991789 RepID=A0A0X8VBL1_ANAPI|nr:DUF6442 family protein [Anaerotignum propionicum]AMJ39924.1 hypothetical protein CPRO_03020 [Anaerotignum propionicum DSM 1682]SHE27302.1 hypothetical protein SAMN02745151_00049 [[Clostridium] propionicum DSM 1682] [Anaerotignum propionicum DSM 1682]